MPRVAWVGSPGAKDWISTYSELGRPGTVRGCGGGNGGWGTPSSGVPKKHERCKVTMTKAAMTLKEERSEKRRQPVLVAPRAAYVELPQLSNIIGDYMRVAPAAEPLLEPPSSRRGGSAACRGHPVVALSGREPHPGRVAHGFCSDVAGKRGAPSHASHNRQQTPVRAD